MQPSIYKRLQHYQFTEESINDILDSIEKQVDDPRWKYFIVKTSGGQKQLFYNNELQVVRPKDKTRILKALYESPEGIAKGLNNFYYLVMSRYLNIKRAEIREFLKIKRITNCNKNRSVKLRNKYTQRIQCQWWRSI